MLDAMAVSPLSANPTKLSNTLKQFVGNLPTNCLSVFDRFVGLVLKGLTFASELKFLKWLHAYEFVTCDFIINKKATNLHIDKFCVLEMNLHDTCIQSI